MAKNEYICDCNIIHLDIVNLVTKDFPDKKIFVNLANLYKMLADETRCKIVYVLNKNKMCVCDIANVLSMSKSAVSHQLAKLKENGIVKSKKEGKEVFYTLDDEHIVKLFEMGYVHIMHKGA